MGFIQEWRREKGKRSFIQNSVQHIVLVAAGAADKDRELYLVWGYNLNGLSPSDWH